MGLEAQRSAVETYFNTAWNGTTPIHFDNVPYVHTDTTTPYVNLTINPGPGNITSMGETPGYQYHTYIQVDIFVPEDTGTKRIATLADSVVDLLKARTIGTLTTDRITFYRSIEQGWLRWSVIFHATRKEC